MDLKMFTQQKCQCFEAGKIVRPTGTFSSEGVTQQVPIKARIGKREKLELDVNFKGWEEEEETEGRKKQKKRVWKSKFKRTKMTEKMFRARVEISQSCGKV